MSNNNINSPFQNYNNQNNHIQKNPNQSRRPPPARKQFNNNTTEETDYNNNEYSKGINSPFAQSNKNENLNSPFNNNDNYNNNIRNVPPKSNNYQNSNINKTSNYQQQQQEQKQEEDEDNTNDNLNDNNERQTPKHKTSQNHKTPDQNYSINPSQIPRPNQHDEIYLNNEKMPVYETNISTAPPHPISFFATKETQNSSPRFIRSTLNSVPISQFLLNETNLLFGLCIQPFAEIPDYEDQVPKVESGESIFRCKQCKSYINNKYNICYSQQNKQVAICNLCQYENEFDLNKPGIKNEYFNSDNSTCPELVKPTIDFIAPKNFKSSKIFLPHYLFMIDITESSYSIGLPGYVINSIQINIDSFDNAENSYIGFGLYDTKNIYFFYVEKNDVRLTIMGDMNDPFCPLSMK